MTRLEKTATATLVFSFLLLAGVVTRGYVKNRAANRAVAPQVKIGEAIKIPDASPGKSHSTLVLVLSSGCHYCMEDLPFYKQLSDFRRPSADIRLLAALPEDVNSARAFLEGAGVFTDGILSLAPGDLGVRIVPTLLLLDRDNKLQAYWAGALSREAQQEVLAALKRACVNCKLASKSEN